MHLPQRGHVERFRTAIARRFGLHYDDARLDYLADVLRQQGEALHERDFGAYIERLTSARTGPNELHALVDALTVNETFFFRNADNFRALSEFVLPERIRQRPERKLHLLSAGCASGEEPYSLAIAIREAIPEIDSWDVRITAVDLSAAMIARAERARYTEWSLRATPEDVRRRYFEAAGRDYVLSPTVQKMVTFEERNLLDEAGPLWRSATYDVVFCRNVIMYFTSEAMRETVQRIARSLLPGGFLFLGHAETLRGLSSDYHLCHTHDTFYYQSRNGAPPGAGVPLSLPAPQRLAVHALPEVIDGAASWLDAIQQASERIAHLAQRPMQGELSPAGRTTPSPAARSWDLGLVLEALRQERFADALQLLSALPPESDADPDALLLRAVLLANSGKLTEAEDTCAQLLRLDELSAGARYVMALCREHAADTAGALEHARTAVYLDPSFAMPQLHLGLMARRAGDYASARGALAQALLLLAREDASRLLLFGGGFSREALLALCRTELRAAENEP